MNKSERFSVLDGLRGAAALVVLTFHLVQQHSLSALPYAGLAVDFFYVLSGFVVAYAYENRLQDERMTVTSFLEVRVKRLYPLVLLGTLFGIALAVFAAITKHSISLGEIVRAGTLALLLLPSFVIPRWPTAYPFNMASWSLTFEAFVNVVYGLIAKHLSNLRLVILTVASALGILWLVATHRGVVGGNNQAGWALGFVRVMFPFFAGVLIYRHRPQMQLRPAASVAVIVTLSVMLLCAWPEYRFISAAYVLILFPIIVYVGSGLTASPHISRLCTVSGAVSYPIYILQGPVLRIGEEVLKHAHLSGWRLFCFNLAEGGSVIAVAWLGLKFFDEPIQRKLRGRFAVPSFLPLGQRL